MTKFLIIDGNSIGCRAAFAGQKHPLTAKNGIPTSTITFFMNMLNKVMMQLKPTHIIVCWDTDSHTFRKELYPEYKANRYKGESIIDMAIVYKQFAMIRRMLDILGIKSANVQGFEGDDVVGSFKALSKADYNYICSGDKDSWALADDKTTIVFPKSGFTDIDLITTDYIEEKLMIKKANYVGLKMLQGDISDNIKGLDGCGPKTAAKLLNEFSNIDKIVSLTVDDLQKYNSKIKNNFLEWKERATLLKQLMTIRTDVSLPYTFEDCEIGLLNWEDFKEYIRGLDMNNFIQRIEWGAVYRLKW